MKLRVNLYQAELQPRFDKMTLKQLGQAAMLVSALLVLVAGFAYQQLSDVKAEQLLVQQQQQQKVKELEIYQQTLATRQPSVLLQQQADLLQQSIEQKQQLLSYLQQESNKSPPHYAQVMQHLDAIDPDGLWLTGFALGTIQRFDGIASSGVMLPEWLKALGTAPALQGLHFNTVKLEPLNEGKYRQFSVQAKVQLPQELNVLLQPGSANATPAPVQAVTAPLSGAVEAAAALKNNNTPGGQP